MKLDKENLLKAASMALENAKELCTEAELLYSNNHFSRAFTLYQLSIEETGKAAILFNSVLFNQYNTKSEKKQILKDIRNHKVKTKVSQGIDLIIAMLIEDKKMKKVMLNNTLKQHREVNKINDYKNYSLYLSIVDNKFVKPSEKITKKLVEDIKFYAEIRLSATQQYQDTISNNLEEISKNIQEINKEALLNNPPLAIKELLNLVEEE